MTCEKWRDYVVGLTGWAREWVAPAINDHQFLGDFITHGESVEVMGLPPLPA